MLDESIKTLVYTILHQRLVQKQMLKLSQGIERRAFCHDDSKLSLQDEFEGLVEINYIARMDGVSSDKYKKSLNSDMVQHHWSVNDHHPEHYQDGIEAMGLIQVIEMVCDWYAVSIQKKLKWEIMIKEQKERFKFTPEQEYLITKIAECLINE